jgi:integrase
MLWRLQGRHPERVFVRANGEPMTYSGVDTAWGRALKKAGVTDLRLHDLRHTAATRLLSKSQNLRLAQKLLRHRDLRSTLRYAHALDEDLRDALEATESPRTNPEARPNSLVKKG